MILAVNPFSFREHAFVWALLLSIGLHGALMASKGFDLSESRPVDSLIIQLQPVMEPPPPPPQPQPEPPKPKPQPPKAPKAKPQPAPEPAQAPELTTPEPLAQPATSPPQPAPAPQPAPPPEVVSVAPQAETTPVFTAPPPPPEPPKVQGPSQQEIDSARNGYSNLLAREFAKHRQYPRLAQMRGWQGTVRVLLELDAQGNIAQSAIKDSSGYEVLDKQALEMVKKASPLPLPPEVLRNRAFSILVPVTFKLG